MTQIEKLQKSFEKGYKIFEKIFEKSDKEVKKYVFEEIDESHKNIFKNNHLNIIRTVINGKPESIKLQSYDSININYIGITFVPEYGTHLLLKKFN